MANAHELARGHSQLRALIEFAVGEGWHVKRTAGGHLKFTKAGCAAIYTSSTASDHRAALKRPCADPSCRARDPIPSAGRRP
jgi:hypothetical protein